MVRTIPISLGLPNVEIFSQPQCGLPGKEAPAKAKLGFWPISTVDKKKKNAFGPVSIGFELLSMASVWDASNTIQN